VRPRQNISQTQDKNAIQSTTVPRVDPTAIFLPNLAKRIDVEQRIRGRLLRGEPKGAAERIRAAVRELKELGIVDEKWSPVRTDLPEDMKEGADRDFGG